MYDSLLKQAVISNRDFTNKGKFVTVFKYVTDGYYQGESDVLIPYVGYLVGEVKISEDAFMWTKISWKEVNIEFKMYEQGNSVFKTIDINKHVASDHFYSDFMEGICDGKKFKMYFFNSYHTFAYYGFFKPDLGEVMGQIPSRLSYLKEKLLNRTAYVNTVFKASMLDEDVHKGVTIICEFV